MKKGINRKIQIILFHKQPTYSDLFKYANKLKGKICMISNSDIWLKNVDLDLIKLIQTKDKLIYALTRHESDGCRPLINKYRMSHDSFIFKSPINYDIPNGMNHIQNKLGSENVIIIGLRKLGYRIYNPCKDIVIIHEHVSGIRTYSIDNSLYYITQPEVNYILQWWQTGKNDGIQPKSWAPPIPKKNLLDIFAEQLPKQNVTYPLKRRQMQTQTQKQHHNPQIRRPHQSTQKHRQPLRRRRQFTRRYQARRQQFTRRHQARRQQFTRRREHSFRTRNMYQQMQAQTSQKKTFYFWKVLIIN